MKMTDFAEEYIKKMLGNEERPLAKTDPEFTEFFSNFVFDNVVNQNDLNGKTRFMAILATLLGCGGKEDFEIILKGALNFGMSAVEAREVIYQSVAYLGIGRVYPFFEIANKVFSETGINIPLENQSTTNCENRLQKGIQAQVDIFGEEMRDFYKSGPEESRHINRWLAENCFGDYYTRTGLDYKQREMITFCFLAAQGGCEPQLISHAAANMKIGNDKKFLINIVSQCVPYIGYPRSLNALRCINEAEKQLEEK